MCGIAAIFSYCGHAPPVDLGEMLCIRDFMERRGPDGKGLWLAENRRVGLAHRRLAIIDLSENGSQPMATPDGMLRVVLNGEIYNYRELRARLRAKGHVFRSESDTEVLLYAYREYGQAMVEHLRGMFAFVIWDEERGGLFLARDHFGIKPLYFHDNGETFRAASQVKALLAGGAIGTWVEPAGHVGFLLWGCVPEPYTLYRNLYALPAGHSLWVDPCGSRAPRRYFDIAEELERAAGMKVEDPAEQVLKAALRDSVDHHLVADVPVGVFLSSGLDSATLTALASEALPPSLLPGRENPKSPKIQAITLGFTEYRGTMSDEVPLAAEVAGHYGGNHHIRRIDRRDFEESLPAILQAMDQPSIDGVNTWLVSREAKRVGLKVVISGLGGDELLGGYPSFRQIPGLVRTLGLVARASALARGLRLISAPLLKRVTSPKYASLLEYGGTYGGAYLLRRGLFMPWELPGLLDGDLAREGWSSLQPVLRLDEWTARVKSPYAKVVAMELGGYLRNMLLRDSDWAGMDHSLEIRVPLVDVTLFRALAPYLARGISPGKRSLAGIPSRPLPDAIVDRSKTGFSIPVHEWIKTQGGSRADRGLRGWANLLYARQDFGRTDPKGRKRILALVHDAYGGRGGIAKFNRDLLWSLCSSLQVRQVIALPRHMPDTPNEIPMKLRWDTSGLGGKAHYLRALWRMSRTIERADLVLCGHLNLLPMAWLVARMKRTTLWCNIHGIDAWQPHKSILVNRLTHHVDRFLAVSDLSRQRFTAWSGVSRERIHLLPNCYDPAVFFPAEQSEPLLERYGLRGKRVLLTIGRLVSREGYKGFDEIIEVLPDLAKNCPTIAYLVVGDGDDRARLEKKARDFGVADKVIFAGYVSESEKADHYRLADVFVMPSRGEGFGIVFLEAMACGVPAIGSRLDGSREALGDGRLGLLVDPAEPLQIIDAVRIALSTRTRTPPQGIADFSLCRFKERAEATLGMTTSV